MRKHILTISLLAAISMTCCAPQREIVYNPYEGVDWGSCLQLKSSLHVHTCNSQIEWGAPEGTTVTPAEQIDRYTELGYDVLALTDHDHISYPWERFDRADSKLVAIEGNELSKNDNMVSLFNDYVDREGMGPNNSDGFFGCIEGVQSRNGVIYLAHPMRNGEICKADFATDVFARYPCVYGMEVLNVGQPERNRSIELWDAVLSNLMPKRQVFGSSSDDAHSTSMAGRGWTTVLATERTPDEVRRALTTGTTLFSTPLTVQNPQGDVPHIESIKLSRRRCTVTIDATNCEQIEWVSMGRVVATGKTFDYAKTAGVGSYFRAVLTGRGGQTFTQPWALK